MKMIIKLYLRFEIIFENFDLWDCINIFYWALSSLQKNYANNHKQYLKFEIGNHVFLKISPIKFVMRLNGKRKFSP